MRQYTKCDYDTDHLGNIRAVTDSNGNITQMTHYYPFGGVFADASTGQSLQPYKYNGKELDRMHGLDWYDYGFRSFDPILHTWDRMDPLCEEYYHLSPYCYCAGNPVNFKDSSGLVIIAFGEAEQDMIRNTLPKDSHEYLKFDENGILDANILSAYTNESESQNFSDLLDMASSEDYTFEIYLNDTIFFY